MGKVPMQMLQGLILLQREKDGEKIEQMSRSNHGVAL